MRFKLIDAREASLSVERACQLCGVSVSGYYAWRCRPISQRQKDDLIYLAHIRSFFAESNGTYGSPRMTVDMQEAGISSDRGSQHCSTEYRKRLEKYSMKGSMSAKGNCYDNAAVVCEADVYVKHFLKP